MAVLGAIAYVAIEFDDSRTSGLIGLLAGGAAPIKRKRMYRKCNTSH